MDENPYQAPQEVDPRPSRGLILIVLAIAATIPAGCICGGLTCFSAGISGEIVAEAAQPNPGPRGVGWFLGIPLGLLVTGCIWYFLGREIWKRRKTHE